MEVHSMEISLQLYSIHGETEKDFVKSIETVGKIGYQGVEFAGYGGLSAGEVKELLLKNHLYSVGSHCGLDFFGKNFKETLAFNKAIGSKYIICPWAKTDTMEDVERLVSTLNAAAELAAKENIKVGYHNHNHELNKIDGKFPLDLIAEKTNENVIIELDIFWAAYAGVDPVEYIKKLGKKAELLHLKQINAAKENVDMADGILDMKLVKKTAHYAKYFILEHEEYDKPVWDSIRNDFDYLN
jgi:sugar phosphate isomerase/epimerase